MKTTINKEIIRRVILLILGVFPVFCLAISSGISADGISDYSSSNSSPQQLVNDNWQFKIWGTYVTSGPNGEIRGNFGRNFKLEVIITDNTVSGNGTDVTRAGFEKPVTIAGTISPNSEFIVNIYENNAWVGSSDGLIHRCHGWVLASGREVQGQLESTLVRYGLESDGYRVEGGFQIITQQTYPPSQGQANLPVPQQTSPTAQVEQDKEVMQGVSFVDSVPLANQLSTNLGVISTNFLFALIMVIIFYVASSIFNSTIRENYSTIQRWVSRGSILFKPFRRFLGRLTISQSATIRPVTRQFEIIAILIISSVIYAFVDPYFSADLSGLSLFLCMAIAIAVLTFGYDGIQVLISKRFGIPSAIRTYPLAILVAIGFVVLSRAVDFRPGLLYGFVGAYTILSANVKPSNRQHGLSVLFSSGVITAIAVISFFLRDLIHSPGANLDNYWLHLADTALVCIFAICLEGVLFNLVPMTFLDGAKVLSWKKWVWAILTTSVAFIFWWIVINKEASLGNAVSKMEVKTMLGLMAFLLVLSIGTWSYFRIRRGVKKTDSVDTAELPESPPSELPEQDMESHTKLPDAETKTLGESRESDPPIQQKGT